MAVPPYRTLTPGTLSCRGEKLVLVPVGGLPERERDGTAEREREVGRGRDRDGQIGVGGRESVEREGGGEREREEGGRGGREGGLCACVCGRETDRQTDR